MLASNSKFGDVVDMIVRMIRILYISFNLIFYIQLRQCIYLYQFWCGTKTDHVMSIPANGYKFVNLLMEKYLYHRCKLHRVPQAKYISMSVLARHGIRCIGWVDSVGSVECMEVLRGTYHFSLKWWWNFNNSNTHGSPLC